MVMRVGQGGEGGGEWGERGDGEAVYTFVDGLNTEIGKKHTDQSANNLTHTWEGGMHANTDMYINARMPTLNIEIAKLQPVSS